MRATSADVVFPASPLSVSQPAISRHLKVLEQAGLVSRTRRATARLSHLEADPLRDATEWLARYREYWDESYERLDALLAALQDDGTGVADEPDTKGDHVGQDRSHG